MGNWRKAKWKNGRRVLTGSYLWDAARQNFLVSLNSKDPVTGQYREMNLGDCESPEWGNWKLVRDEEPKKKPR